MNEANRDHVSGMSTSFDAKFFSILAAALVLRLYSLWTRNLWFDEAWSWSESQRSVSAIIEESRTDPSPPLYHLLLKFWTLLFGQSVAALRTPSLLASVLIVLLAYVVARRVVSDRAALIGSFFLALSPHQIFYAQEARMYAIVTVFALGAVLCYINLLQDGSSKLGSKIGYVALVTLMMYTHVFGFLVLGAINVHFLWRLSRLHRKGERTVGLHVRNWILLHLAVLVLYSPWIGSFFFQVMARPRQEWRMRLGSVWVIGEELLFLSQMIVGYFAYPQSLYYSWKNLLDYRWDWELVIRVLRQFALYPAAFTIAIPCLIRGTLAAGRERIPSVLFYVPLLTVSAALLVIRPQIDLARYLMLISPYYMLLIATGIDALKRRLLRSAFIAALSVTMLLGLQNQYRAASFDSDYRPIATILKQQLRPGDWMVLDPYYMDRCLRYYLRGTGLDQAIIELADVPELIANQFPAARETQVNPPWQTIERIWVVLDYRSSFFPATEEQLVLSGLGFVVSRDEQFPTGRARIRLLLLERRTLTK